MGYRAKRKMGEPGERSAVWERDFCLRPIPHLGACSKATICKKKIIIINQKKKKIIIIIITIIIIVISKKEKNAIHCFLFYGFLE